MMIQSIGKIFKLDISGFERKMPQYDIKKSEKKIVITRQSQQELLKQEATQ